jgi:hypothetical protein
VSAGATATAGRSVTSDAPLFASTRRFYAQARRPPPRRFRPRRRGDRGAGHLLRQRLRSGGRSACPPPRSRALQPAGRAIARLSAGHGPCACTVGAGRSTGSQAQSLYRCGPGCPPGSEPLRTRPDPPVVETSSRPPQAGLEGQVPLLLSPGALPPAGRLVWRSPVGSTGRGGLETRRSSVWLSSTSRNFCACTRSGSPRRTARCVRWSSGCSGPSSPVGSSIAVSPAPGVGRAA